MTLQVVQFLGHRVAFHAQFGSRFVHQVDGLVGQEAVGNVAFAQFDGRDAGVVLYSYLVVVLVSFFQTTENADGVKLVGLVDHDRLEAAFERLVLLEVLLILVEGRGADGPQLSPGQGRLQYVGRVHGPFASSGTDERVNLVYEEDDVAVGVGHFLDDALEPLLKFALILGSCHERAHIERVELLVFQVLRHVATDDSLGQSFYDSRLSGSRFTY